MSRRGTPRKQAATQLEGNARHSGSDADASSPSTPTRPSKQPASATNTPAIDRGPTPTQSETSFHKRTRGLIVEHRRLRREFAELSVRGLIARTRATVELWQELETALKHIDSQNAQASLGQDKQRLHIARPGYILAQSKRLQDHVAAIDVVLDSLYTCVQAMSNVCDKAEQLVIEASKLKGHVFAFREPLWATWPLSKFSDGLQALTMPYKDALVLTESLLDTLLTFPPLPANNPPVDQSTHAPTSGEEGLSKPQSLEAIIDSTSMTIARNRLPGQRPSSETIQACMSMLAVQPLLPSKDRHTSSEAWEEFIAVEMPV
ncbi:hypothetical protein OIV83_004575 [Microbotryomycetes sp. JL201]|nr:hypothetical protein OIV83_004575 [Microbotryomycetes sp. JL201]